MDLFSSLPDEVVSHILSFLVVKEAALTSVLAKRWRNLFAFVPNLHIDDSVFLYPEEGKREREGVLESFMDFVDRVLELQGNSTVQKMSLKCQGDVDPDRVNGWICNVLKRGVSDLDLFIDYGDSMCPQVFMSKTLVELKIGGSGIRFDEWDSGSIFLPMLKTLVLEAVVFSSDQFATLLRCAPVLEELELVDMVWQTWDVTVSSASLKRLTIKPRDYFETFSFDIPSLVFLDYSEFVAGDYPVVNLENVVDARINLLISDEQVERARNPGNFLFENVQVDDVVRRFGNVKKLMKGIRNVHKLFLSATTLEVLSLCCEAMPVFKNLKFLAIYSHVEYGWQAMPVLLKNCPHLETLSIWGLLHDETDKCGDACTCVSREDKGRSLMSCPVKRLEIRKFQGTIEELTMLKHFLRSFPCLKKMEIYADKNYADFELVYEEMTFFDELSSCVVHFIV